MKRRAIATPRQVRLSAGPRGLGLAFIFALAAPCFASCSFIEPEVGTFRGSCQGSAGEYARPDGYTPDQPDPRCTPDDHDDACEVCEDTHCCGTRFGCYDNDACACADQELDKCLEAVADGTTEGGSAAIARCWAAFSASHPLAKARVECQHTFCRAECSVP